MKRNSSKLIITFISIGSIFVVALVVLLYVEICSFNLVIYWSVLFYYRWLGKIQVLISNFYTVFPVKLLYVVLCLPWVAELQSKGSLRTQTYFRLSRFSTKEIRLRRRLPRKWREFYQPIRERGKAKPMQKL